MHSRICFRLAVTFLALSVVPVAQVQSAEPPQQVAYEHRIRVKVLKAEPVERTPQVQLYKLEVERFYGKIQTKHLNRARKHETQRFTILFPAHPKAVIKPFDIIDYKIVGYLSLNGE